MVNYNWGIIMSTRYFNHKEHINNLIVSDYYLNLILLRNSIQLAIDEYFQRLNAPKVDLFLISDSVSSPMGKGSDSLPILIEFGKKHTYLVDSAQFGMEPLVQKKFEIVYCYLPSFRGEDPDDRHLNQFYHCEAELRGDYTKSMDIAEGLVKYILRRILKDVKAKKYSFEENNFKILDKVVRKRFPRITFNEVCKCLEANDLGHLIEHREYGRVLTNKGEIEVGRLIGKNTFPVWITDYDRDTVPFYQMVDKDDEDKVLNADLIFPKINGGFGGEVIGSGQRHNKAEDMIKSLNRQEIKNIAGYDWYINLRKNSSYKTTSGFGLGIERLIAWLLGINSIIDTAIYPVLKDEGMDKNE